METPLETKPQEFEYRAEMRQLLHLIIHSLYTHQEIFLRELVSNASDALNKVRFRMLTDRDVVSADAPLEIHIRPDAEGNRLEVEDTGIGMTRDDLVARLGTIASSGTLAFLEELKASGKPLDAQLIGQFGVGFYAAFMVADEVVVETRHADAGSQGYRWRSRGEGTYSIEEIDRAERGTKIILHLKDEAKEFGREDRVRQIVRRYSNFVDFPIYLGEDQVNTVKALWHRPKDELKDEELADFYKFVSGDFEAPLGHLHLHVEGRVSFRALLFVPGHAPLTRFRDDDLRGPSLYSSKVFIQDDCKALLPEYLRFVRGVVDTEDLPLNVSREVTQSSPVMVKIRQVLTGKVLGLLEEWAAGEPEKYERFYDAFGTLLQTGLNSDFGNRERILALLRFESTRTEKGKRASLKDYVGRMAPDQQAIYYVLGNHRDTLERNPNLEYFRKHDLEVLLLTDPVDVFTIPHLDAYDGKPLQSIEKADLDLKADEAAQEDALTGEVVDRLLARFKTALGDRVEDVVASKRLVDSAATLVVGQNGLDAQMERMMKLMDQDFKGGRKVLEVNPAHPLLKNLSGLLDAGGQDDLVEKTIFQLYEGALLLDGNLPDPATFVARMTELMARATGGGETA